MGPETAQTKSRTQTPLINTARPRPSPNAYVELGETVDQIFDLAIGMEPEDGIIWVYGPGDDGAIAFTPFGIENLQVLIEMNRDPDR